MNPILKKFSKYLGKLLYGQSETVVEFNSRTDEVEGHHYLICRAIVPDIPEMLAIEKAVYQGKTPWNFETFKQELSRRKTTLYLVARHEDDLVGFAGIDLKRADGEAHITNIAVSPSHQKRGLGSKLLRMLIECARKQGCQKVILEVKASNDSAQKIYQELGFKMLARKKNYYEDEQEDALTMRLDLIPQGRGI